MVETSLMINSGELPAILDSALKLLARQNLMAEALRLEPISFWPAIPAFLLSSSSNVTASGFALEEEQAARKALAELLERYSMSVYERGNLVRGSWKDLKKQGAINPQAFSGFSERQMSLPENAVNLVGDSSILAWARAISLRSHEKVLVPAQLLYFNLARDLCEPFLRRATSNGAAAGSSWEMAAYNAVCEAIERDAFLIHWLNLISPPRIELDSMRERGNEQLEKLLDFYQKYRIKVTVFDITTDLGVPAVLTAVRQSALGRQVVYVSSRADLNLEEALVASLTNGLRAGFFPPASEAELARLRSQASHVSCAEERRTYWSDPQREKDSDFLWQGPNKKLPPNLYPALDFPEKLAALCDILKKADIEVWLADITASPAKELGLTVLMSLTTKLVPFHLDEWFKCLGPRRLYEAPVKMGFLSVPKKEEELNQVPHPML